MLLINPFSRSRHLGSCSFNLSSPNRKCKSAMRCAFATHDVIPAIPRMLDATKQAISEKITFALRCISLRCLRCHCRNPLQCIRSRPGKPNQRKSPSKKFMNFAHFCEFWCFSLGKQARFTLNFCSGMPPGKVHELAFLWFGLPG